MTHPNMRTARARGFTLIELMITVAIIAILAAVALPSYLESVKRSRRADAKAALLENAQWMERIYSVTNNYNKKTPTSTTADMANSDLPVKQSPKTGTAQYNITFIAANLTATAFTLQAVPTGAMTGDKCGTFTLTNTGVKDVSGNAAGTNKESCWDR